MCELVQSESKLRPAAEKYGIRLILAFGSSVTGVQHPRSDLDLGILIGQNDLSLEARGELAHQLQQVFPEREVDLAILDRADPLFLKKVTERCRLLFGSESDLHQLKIFAFRRYQDHRRFLEMEARFARAFIREVAHLP